MRISVVIGVLLIVLGALALSYQGFTFFTQERVVEAGPFHIDVSRPHTIILHPIVGIVALVVGLLMVFTGRGARDV